jgi:hypothetical protein
MSAQSPGSETTAGDLIKDWERQKEMLTAIADATPAQRSYGEQIMHIASVNVQILGLVGGTAAAPSFTAESATTKAEILQARSDSYDYGITLLNEQMAVYLRLNDIVPPASRGV